MEEKKQMKISMSGFFLILAIIVIAVMGYFIYKISTEKTEKENQIASLNNEVSNLQSSSRELQGKIDNIANTINSNDNVSSNYKIENDKYEEITGEFDQDNVFAVTDVEKNSDKTYTLKGVVFTKLTMSKSQLEELAKKGIFKYYNLYDINSDYEYTVKKDYSDEWNKWDFAFINKWKDEERVTFIAEKKDENTYYIKTLSQFPDEWVSTNQYKKITVPADTVVENDYENVTVENEFKEFKSIDSSKIRRISRGFNFKFQDGKCQKIIQMNYSM